MKTERQKERNTQVQWRAWSCAQYAGETERERNTETYIPKTLTQCQYMCVFNEHVLYKSLQGLIEVLSYFNAL